MEPTHPLERLRAELSVPVERFFDPTRYPRLSVVECDGLLHVDFFGCPLLDAPVSELFEILSRRDVADKLASLVLRSPDAGANGTCNWDLTRLVETDTVYPCLQLLSIQQNGPSDHNRMIVAAVYEEAGVLGRILQKAPVLDALITPSAPDESFFSVRNHPLRYLNVDAGYDTQNFIAHLAESESFPGLRSFEFGEYNETYIDTFPQGCTAFADYERLFRSRAFSNVDTFKWRNPVCSPAEIAALQKLRPPFALGFKVVRFSYEYLRK